MYIGINTIYLIHHSHTDIGYTHDQPIVWDLHRRFIDTAIDQCEREADDDSDHAFRWTVETTAMLMHWLESASEQRIARFVDLVNAGRIEVTGMYLNMTPLADTDQLVETLAPVRFLRDKLGIPVRHAMNSDVNGQNWPLVDVLLDAGISGISMATNIHFGGSPLAWPNAFHWQGPSGRSILAWNGWDYGFAREAGVGEQLKDFRDHWWPRMDNWLREREYALPVLMLQIYDIFGDNGPACSTLPAFVREWNVRVGTPRLRIALPGEWWGAVGQHANRLPTHRGDWTDYWNFGCGSSAREVAINRASRIRLRAADAAMSVLEGLGGEDDLARCSTPGTRGQAWHSLHLWDEHTWGADRSIRGPSDEDTVSQWHHKANSAYTARSLSTMLARDAVAELARRIERAPDDAMVVFNALPFPRTVAVVAPEAVIGSIRGRPDDPTAARHWLDRTSAVGSQARSTEPVENSRPALMPVELPGFGYRVIQRAETASAPARTSDARIVDTAHHRVTFNLETGGITSWYSKALDRELVDQEVNWPLGGWVHERPIMSDQASEEPRRVMWRRGERRLSLERGWQPGWLALRRGPESLLEHRVEHRDDGVEVLQRFKLPTGMELRQNTYLPAYARWIECASTWQMGLETDPEGTYIAFPFMVPGATARLDLGGQAMQVDSDQLPRSCRDYFTAQGWVDLSNAEFGVAIACPDAPMVQLGDFTFASNLETVELPRAMMLGWVTNNYWETNFRAHQPGTVGARYRLLPHAGAWNESDSHRFGLDAAFPPLIHHLQEPPVAQPPLPRSGSLLKLPESPVLTLHAWPDGDAVYLRLLNASDQPTIATVGSAALRIGSAESCDILGVPDGTLMVEDDAAAVPMGTRSIATLRLQVGPNAQSQRHAR